MWTVEDLEHPHQTLQSLRAELSEWPEVAPVLQQLDEVDTRALTESMAKELEKSFLMYRSPRYLKREAYEWVGEEPDRRVVIEPLSAIVLYWAGAEVSPFVPTTVWCDGYRHYEPDSEGELNLQGLQFDSCGGFEFSPIADLLQEIAEDEELSELPCCRDLKKLLVLTSIECAKAALAIATQSEAFRQLSKRLPFAFFGTPGHDEPTGLLLRVEQ